MSDYERPSEVPDALRKDLADWLLALADNKRILGLRYAEWCVGAPEIEADVAISAMAQYELGHARLLRGALADLPEDPRGEERQTDPSAWRCLPALDRPAANWAELIVINALVDNLLTVNMVAAARGGVRLLAQRLRKAVSEEHYHSLHAEAWIGRLAAGPEHVIEMAQRAADEIWPQCLAWFGPEGDNSLDRLAAAGVINGGAAELRGRLLAIAGPLFAGKIRLAVEHDEAGWTADVQIDWRDWDETRRRHGGADFDAESFAMITGAHARAMGVQD